MALAQAREAGCISEGFARPVSQLARYERLISEPVPTPLNALDGRSAAGSLRNDRSRARAKWPAAPGSGRFLPGGSGLAPIDDAKTGGGLVMPAYARLSRAPNRGLMLR